jgi:predicted DNA-binding transcriptional regulator AlpA
MKLSRPDLQLSPGHPHADLADMSGESVVTWRRRNSQGVGPKPLKLPGSRHVRFRPEDVAEWLAACAANDSAKEVA